MFIINPQSGIPIYRQLMEQIRRMISSGQLQPGDNLPSVREIAVNNAVNPMTISKAYSLLETEGLLERQRGKPMKVAINTSLKKDKEERLHHLQALVDQLAMAAEQLELEPDEVLQVIRIAIDDIRRNKND